MISQFFLEKNIPKVQYLDDLHENLARTTDRE